MARAYASTLSIHRLARVAAMSAVLSLSGCIGSSVFDQINDTQPVGSPFAAALFKDYAFLAKSFGTESSPAGQAFDAEGAISLTGEANTVSGLAVAYAQKALAAGRGDEVLPEPAPDGDADAENVRLELLRDLDDGRDKAPEDAARAQADFDCWIMNHRLDSLAAAAMLCRRNVTASLKKLEQEINPTPASTAETPAPGPAPAPTPAPAPAPTPAPVQFTVYFAFHSATLSADAQATIAEAIAAARSGRQSRITVVGHADTEENSQRLSMRRADAVKSAMVLGGARVEAVAASGVGKDDLAVQTDDHVKEPKNRRVVISLLP